MRLLVIPGCMMTGYVGFAADADQEQEDEVYELSPFEVETSDEDVGYYASSTLAGTRMNSSLKDLAASITVVTAQQLEDTASVDINDVFLYEANTEGTHTYTEFSINRFGGVSEGVQMAPQTANRIRGIGSADRAVDYFVSLPEIPIDSYNTDRLTINRGPNSVLYGLGSAAGLVNVSPARAHIGADSTRLQFRVGSWGDARASVNLNRTVVEDRLAVRFAAMYHERGYRQEPAYDYTRRYYGAITYRPFENTTLRFSYENYDTDYRRPNATTPQDFISHWRAAGSPTFNPSTMMVTRGGMQFPIMTADQGELSQLSNTGLSNHAHNTRPAFLVENGNSPIRIQRHLHSSGVQSGGNLPERVVETASVASGDGPLFVLPGIQDKSIYNWDQINLLSGNFGRDEAETFQIMLEQQVTDDLFIEVGYRKEDFNRFALNAQSGGQARIFVDANETLLSGEPNPFFLKPYIETWEPTSSDRPTTNDTLRATAAYELDFTDNDGWVRWLGRHNLMGLGQKREVENSFFRWREAVISDHSWTGDPGSNIMGGPNPKIRQNRVYYLGQNGVITHAPGKSLMREPPPYGGDYPEGVVGQTWGQTLRHWVPATDENGDWLGRDGNETGYGVPGGRPLGFWMDERAIAATALHDATRDQEQVDSVSAAMQSYFWDDRIVTTIGWRDDTRKARFAEGPDINELGFRDNVRSGLNLYEDPWDEVSGSTYTKGIVIHPLSWLSLHYNESDNFSPEGLSQDLFLNNLPLPTGEGEDYGVAFSLLENKLIARVNWYEASQANARSGGDTGTITWRTRRVELESSWGLTDMIEREIELRDGLEEGSLNVWNDEDPETQPYFEEISNRSGLPLEFLHQNIGFNDTRTISSEGMEISVDYNPSRNWSMKLTASRQETIESEVAPNTQEWLFGDGDFANPEEGTRLHTWMNATFTEPDATEVGNQVPWWTTEGWPGMPSWAPTPQDWYLGVVEAPFRLLIATQGTPRPQVREWRWAFITNYRFIEGPLEGTGVGGSIRWEDKASIGNFGITNPNTGIIDQYDPERPIYDDSRYYYDFWASYNTRIFDDRIRLKLQLNVRNVFEDGGLQAVGANPDGVPHTFRIRDPRTFFVTSTFEF